MSNIIERVASDLFEGDIVVRDIKFCYRPGTTGDRLADYRERVHAQIRAGLAVPYTELDEVLRNSSVD